MYRNSFHASLPAALILAAGVLPLRAAMGGLQDPAPAGPAAAAPRSSRADASLEAIALKRSRSCRLEQQRVRFETFSGGTPRDRLVTLTFDDGPDPTNTPKILDILKREHVPATFFVIGSKVEKSPDLVQREAAEGHDLGNHTYHHLELTEMNTAGVRFEIQRTNEALERVVGGPTRWFRAPGCHYTPDALKVIDALHMVRVDTTDNSGDWSGSSPATILHRTLSRLGPGDVILCHDRMPNTVQALPEMIREIRQRGYRIVPLAQLAAVAQSTRGFRPPMWPADEGVRLSAVRLPHHTAGARAVRPLRQSTASPQVTL